MSAVRGPSPSLFDGLAAKQAVVTLLIALGFGLLGSLVELFLDLRSTRAEIGANMQRILELTRPSAAEAAYLLNEQLAQRVVSGLAGYTAVRSVELSDDSGLPLARDAGEPPPEPAGWLAERLFGDLTRHGINLEHEGRPVGRLDLSLSPDAMAQGFLGRVHLLAAGSLARAFAISLLVVLVFYATIIRPLSRLSREVSGIDPARPGAAPLPPATGHHRDEIGRLIAAFNRLMSEFQRGLDQRDEAERGLTRLTQELEERVEQRTRALAAAKQEIETLNRKLAADNQRMSAELDVSRKLQRMILPTPDELTDLPGLDVATYMESANEIGGDYYDILRDHDRLRIGIGDVTGHGLESGVVMLMTQSAVRTLMTRQDHDLSRTLSVLNRTLHDNVRRMGSDKHLTLALLDYQSRPGGGVLRIGGQHESLLLVRAGGKLEIIDTVDLGMPLGLIDDVDPYCGETEVTLAPGDIAVLYTDGITEAANLEHKLYGLPRLCEVIVAHRAEPAEAIRQAVVNDVMRHIGTQTIYDDLTLIVLKQKEYTP